MIRSSGHTSKCLRNIRLNSNPDLVDTEKQEEITFGALERKTKAKDSSYVAAALFALLDLLAFTESIEDLSVGWRWDGLCLNVVDASFQ